MSSKHHIATQKIYFHMLCAFILKAYNYNIFKSYKRIESKQIFCFYSSLALSQLPLADPQTSEILKTTKNHTYIYNILMLIPGSCRNLHRCNREIGKHGILKIYAKNLAL